MAELFDVLVHVIDSETGDVLDGVNVKIIANDNLEEFECITGPGGCILNAVFIGQYEYIVSKEGYLAQTGNIEISEGSSIGLLLEQE